MDGRLWGIGRVILLAAMVGTGACGEDTPPGGSRDTGVSRDTGTGDASTEDAGDSDATVEDTGVVEACIPGDPSMEIESVRTAAAGAQTPSLAVCGAWVTYVRPAIGADPAGFFLQSNPSGPAIFVAVDPASLAPTPVVGDRVGLRATETVVQDGQVRITAVTNFERISTDNDTASLVQDLSAATDVVTNLNDYDSELITVTGTLTGAFIGAGEGHQRIQLSTAGLSDDENLRFRVVTSLIADLGLLSGCVVTVGPTPLWRFNDVAQPSAWRAEDVQVQRCANGPEVVGARATSASTVEITFSRPIAAASVLSELFSFDPFLNIVSVAVDGSVVTIETEPMVPLASYTVTVDTAVTDDLGAGVDPNGNTATFVAPGDAPAPNAPGSVVITEIMQNPALLNDTVGEYIEVYNTSTVTVDLNGCVLADAENDSHTITMPVTIAPGGYATLARSANPGFVPSYVFSDFLLGNGADEVVLRCGDELIDSVEYDGGPMFPDPTGASMNLNPDLLTAEDNDLGANWCESTSVFNGDRGTPNAANDSCAMMDAGVPMDAGMEADASTGPDASADAGFVPDGGVDPDAGMMPDAGGAPDGGITADAGGAPDGGIMADAGGAPDGGVANDAGVMPVPGEGDLVITEIMQNPSTLEDSMGEWFEIYNPTATTYELSGCSIADDGSDTHAILGSLMIFPGAYLTFSNGSMPGFTPDYIYTGVFLANGADEVILRCGSVIVDRVAYDGGPEFPDPTGASMNLDPALLDAIMNDMGSSWCEGVTDYNGDRGTPGQANTPCSSPDAGSAMDAGSDAGSMMDAGSSADAGSTMDAGLDAGSTMDSGVDAGSTTDAGVDAGSAMDAGSSADAGSAMDAGSGADGGTGPVPPDTAGQVVITEIMNNPTTVADAMGEWFELYNPSASVTYELDGCEIKDDGTDTHVVLGPLQIGPGEYLAMANSMMPGFTPGYIYDGSMFTLDNGTDEVVFKCSGEFIDRVAYDSGATYPNVAGRSMNLSPLRLDAFENNVGANWCVASEVYNGDFGTPGTANSPCP